MQKYIIKNIKIFYKKQERVMSYLMKGATVYRYPNYIQFNIAEYCYIPKSKNNTRYES